jgi:sec-independent protein translocase protein TatA
MGAFSIWHLMAIIVIVALVFGGRGKIANVMGDFAKGIKAFKSGMREDEVAQSKEPSQVLPPDTQAAKQPAHDHT